VRTDVIVVIEAEWVVASSSPHTRSGPFGGSTFDVEIQVCISTITHSVVIISEEFSDIVGCVIFQLLVVETISIAGQVEWIVECKYDASLVVASPTVSARVRGDGDLGEAREASTTSVDTCTGLLV